VLYYSGLIGCCVANNLKPMIERTNQEWLDDLTGKPDRQTAALADLRERLQRGIYFYLSRERSDLQHLAPQDLQQMAEDLAQDATLRVMNNLNSFRGDSRFTTWATKIAVRLAISDLRRARYKDFRLEELTAEGDLLPATMSGARPCPRRRALPNGLMYSVKSIML
jgi:RNA polymerase sigma-70 factor, ECF subfamily